MKLRPNCLLTRKPILFITPCRSPFYYKKPWGKFIELLSSHGYNVEILQLPFQNTKLRRQSIEHQITNMNSKHIVVDHVTFEETKDLLASIQNSTLTVITSKVNFLKNNNSPKCNNDKYFQIQSSTENPIFTLYALHELYMSLCKQKIPHSTELYISINENDKNVILNHFIKLAELDFMTET